jgi:2-keto-3-deoxy-L-fuconate dehydrogenase
MIAKPRPDMAKGSRLLGKRVLVTQSSMFMGPAVIDLFSKEGATVIADDRDLKPPAAASQLIAEAGQVDVLIINLAIDNPRAPAHETSDEEWALVYDTLVHPTYRLTRAVLPQMMARKNGKIIVVGSAAALRGTARRSCYGSARGAQHSFVRSAAIEAAPHNIQINATGQIFVENPTYFPPEILQSKALKQRLKDVPAGRVSTGEEAAAFLLYLAGPDSDFITGQVFAYAGGWVA